MSHDDATLLQWDYISLIVADTKKTKYRTPRKKQIYARVMQQYTAVYKYTRTHKHRHSAQIHTRAIAAARPSDRGELSSEGGGRGGERARSARPEDCFCLFFASRGQLKNSTTSINNLYYYQCYFVFMQQKSYKCLRTWYIVYLNIVNLNRYYKPDKTLLRNKGTYRWHI